MRKFIIEIRVYLDVYYNHYLSTEFINGNKHYLLKDTHQLRCYSRRFDKPAIKLRNGTCFWKLDKKYHRVGNPAVIYFDGYAEYFENGKKVK